MTSDMREGTVLRGKYRVERVLGFGGMGVVVLATHLRLGQKVAIKLLKDSVKDDPHVAARFSREARAAAQIVSEHVVRILDVDDTERGDPFLVMEYLEGKDLAGVLDEEGPLPVERAVDYL